MPTTSSGLRYPASSAAPNVPQDIQNLASDADAKVIPAYANITARNTAIPSPTQGRSCTVNGLLHTYDGTAWRWCKRGETNATTDASGFLIVAHGLGANPTGIVLSPGPQGSDLLNRVLSINWSSKDSSNFTAYAHRDDTNAALPSSQIEFSWVAFV